MRQSPIVVSWVAALALAVAATAFAQLPAPLPPAQALPGVDTSRQWRLERVGTDHWKLIGDVEVERGDTKVFADEMEIFTDKNLLTAKGNVTLTTSTQRISADAMEYDLKTSLAVFHNASGSAALEQDPTKPKSPFGTQENQILFYGQTIEKVGERKYRITKGGFTTCLQPTPRWSMTSSTVVLNIDHYAMLRNPIFRVKGVPVLYVPIIYYPINKEDRATGILLPMYGSSTLRGHSFSNAFFWAISRSQDATFMHDWFSKTGQGYGADYRYVGTAGSGGSARFYRLNEKPTTYPGSETVVAGRKSLQLNGNLSQTLPWKLRSRARVDYFSDITVQQTFNTNIYDATRRSRYYGGSISGNWGSYSLTGTVDRNEYFFNNTQSTVTGMLPRISFNRGEKPLFGSPVYVSVGGDYSGIVRKTVNNKGTVDAGLQRFDMTPTVRYPFTKWPFLTANSSLSWRYTWWSDSLSPVTSKQVPLSIDRTYFDLATRIVGPVINRIWIKSPGGYAEKIKHTIEPWVTLQRTTMVDDYSQIVKIDGTDTIIGGTTQIAFGLENRIYAKRPSGEAASQAVQIVGVSLRQTYYTDARASQYDPRYVSSYGGTVPKKMSPISIAATVSPTGNLNAAFRTEFDTYYNAFLTIGAQGTYSFRDWLYTSTGWSQRRVVTGLAGYDVSRATHYLNSDTTLQFKQNKIGGSVSFNWDIRNNFVIQSRFTGYYNAQCCGITVGYQTYNFSNLSSAPVKSDHRFSVSISLAGIGSFSPMSGALGGGTLGYR